MDEKKFTSRKMAQPYMFWVSWFLSRSCHLRTAIWRSLNTAWDQSTTPNNWWSIVLLMSTEPMVLLLLGSRSLLQSIMKKHLFMRGFTFPFKISCWRFDICMSQSSVRLWLRSEISCWRNMIPSFHEYCLKFSPRIGKPRTMLIICGVIGRTLPAPILISIRSGSVWSNSQVSRFLFSTASIFILSKWPNPSASIAAYCCGFNKLVVKITSLGLHRTFTMEERQVALFFLCLAWDK